MINSLFRLISRLYQFHENFDGKIIRNGSFLTIRQWLFVKTNNSDAIRNVHTGKKLAEKPNASLPDILFALRYVKDTVVKNRTEMPAPQCMISSNAYIFDQE